MELKFVIPNMAKSLGNLEFGGPAEVKRGDPPQRHPDQGAVPPL